MLLMLSDMTMMVVVGLWRRWRRAANGVHTTELLLTARAICRLQWTILVRMMMMMIPMVSNLLLLLLLLVVMLVLKSQLRGRSSNFTCFELGLLMASVFLQLVRLQRSVTALQSLHVAVLN